MSISDDVVGEILECLKHSTKLTLLSINGSNNISACFYPDNNGRYFDVDLNFQIEVLREVEDESLEDEVNFTVKTPPTSEEIELQLKNAASVVLNFDYPSELKIALQNAFDQKCYQKVLDLAADYDVLAREKLDSKIVIVPNPNYKEPEAGDLASATVDQMVDAVFHKDDSVNKYQDEENVRKNGRIYEAEYGEPLFLYQIEGLDETFKSVSKLVAAYKAKYGDTNQKPKSKHSFRRNPKVVTVDSPPAEVAQSIPKTPHME